MIEILKSTDITDIEDYNFDLYNEGVLFNQNKNVIYITELLQISSDPIEARLQQTKHFMKLIEHEDQRAFSFGKQWLYHRPIISYIKRKITSSVTDENDDGKGIKTLKTWLAQRYRFNDITFKTNTSELGDFECPFTIADTNIHLLASTKIPSGHALRDSIFDSDTNGPFVVEEVKTISRYDGRPGYNGDKYLVKGFYYKNVNAKKNTHQVFELDTYIQDVKKLSNGDKVQVCMLYPDPITHNRVYTGKVEKKGVDFITIDFGTQEVFVSPMFGYVKTYQYTMWDEAFSFIYQINEALIVTPYDIFDGTNQVVINTNEENMKIYQMLFSKDLNLDVFLCLYLRSPQFHDKGVSWEPIIRFIGSKLNYFDTWKLSDANRHDIQKIYAFIRTYDIATSASKQINRHEIAIPVAVSKDIALRFVDEYLQEVLNESLHPERIQPSQLRAIEKDIVGIENMLFDVCMNKVGDDLPSSDELLVWIAKNQTNDEDSLLEKRLFVSYYKSKLESLMLHKESAENREAFSSKELLEVANVVRNSFDLFPAFPEPIPWTPYKYKESSKLLELYRGTGIDDNDEGYLKGNEFETYLPIPEDVTRASELDLDAIRNDADCLNFKRCFYDLFLIRFEMYAKYIKFLNKYCLILKHAIKRSPTSNQGIVTNNTVNYSVAALVSILYPCGLLPNSEDNALGDKLSQENNVPAIANHVYNRLNIGKGEKKTVKEIEKVLIEFRKHIFHTNPVMMQLQVNIQRMIDLRASQKAASEREKSLQLRPWPLYAPVHGKELSEGIPQFLRKVDMYIKSDLKSQYIYYDNIKGFEYYDMLKKNVNLYDILDGIVRNKIRKVSSSMNNARVLFFHSKNHDETKDDDGHNAMIEQNRQTTLVLDTTESIEEFVFEPTVPHLQTAYRDLSNKDVRNDRGVYQLLSGETPDMITKFSSNIENLKDLSYMKDVFSQGTTLLRDNTPISPDALLLALQKCVLIARKSISRICNNFEIDSREVSNKIHIPSKERKVILDMFYKDDVAELFNEGVSDEAKNDRLQQIIQYYDIGNLLNVIKTAHNNRDIMSDESLLRRVSILIGNVIMSSLNKLFDETSTISSSSINEDEKIDSLKRQRNQFLYDIMVEMNNVFDSLEIDFERVRTKIENLREKKKQDQLQKLRGITPEMMELYNVFKRANLTIGENQLVNDDTIDVDVLEEDLNNGELLSVTDALNEIRDLHEDEAGTKLTIEHDIDNIDFGDNRGSADYE